MVTSERTVLPKREGLWRKLKRSRTLLLMCLPAILFFFLFSYVPMPGSYIAFTKFNYNAGIFKSQFIGFKNFEFLFTSGQLALLLKNTVMYNLLFFLAGNFFQITFAILLNEVRSRWFKRVTQSIMFLPYFISAVLVSLLLYNLINWDYGFISSQVRAMGGVVPKLYSRPNVWPLIMVLVHLWQSTGYGTIIYFAAIMGIDASILEAATVDGANGFQRIRYILLPHMKSTVVILFLFAIGGILRGNFGLFYNIVGTNSVLYNTTDIIETYVYRAMMNNFNFSQGSAVGLFQSVVGFVIVVLANGIIKKIEPDYALF